MLRGTIAPAAAAPLAGPTAGLSAIAGAAFEGDPPFPIKDGSEMALRMDVDRRGSAPTTSGPSPVPVAAALTVAAFAASGRCQRRATRGGRSLVRCAPQAVTQSPPAAGTADPLPSSSVAPQGQANADTRRPRVAVVGAGWGGIGAARALCENGCEVVLLDGNPDPTASAPTPTGKPFEAGTRGFWRDYPNIYGTLAEIGVKEEDAFSDYTESAFYSPDGLEATAPVFSDSPQLPSPLGQVFASFSRFKRLPVADRLSISGLLLAMLDFTRDEETFEAYDRMTAHELFIRAGLSRRLVEDFLRPTLLVGLFKPPEELSAAVTMELLYFYALAHQNSFDVRWLRRGTVSETLVKPIVEKLSAEHNLEVRGGCFVEGLDLAGGRVTGLRFKERGSDPKAPALTLENLDAVVLALGAGGMRSVLRGTPELARRCPNLSSAAALQGVDVMACRLWLDGYVATETPANVFSRFPGLRGAGGTFFMLDQLQPDQEALWGDEKPRGSVVACDFYNAGSLLSLSDEDIVKLLASELLPASVPGFGSVRVVDSCVRRYPGAVTWFSPGSYRSRPTLETNVTNLVCAGDWVRLGEREHGAKGLCQERAYVTGLEAANSLARRGVLGNDHRRECFVAPVREDEPQVVAGRAALKSLAKVLKPFGMASPWAR